MRVVGMIEDWILKHKLAIARNMLIVVCSLLLILAWAVFIPGFGPATSLGQQDPQINRASTPTVSADRMHIEALTAQLEEVRRTDERLLQTVYWALGTLAAVAAGLIFFSWFTTVRMSDRERVQLRQELEGSITSQADSAIARIDEALSKVGERIAEEVSAQLQVFENEHQERFNSLEQSIAITHLEMLSTEAREHAARGNHLEVFAGGVTMILVGLRTELFRGIAQGLDLVQTALQQGARPSVDQVAAINELLNELPERFATDRDIIRTSLSEARNRTAVDMWEEE